MWGWVILVIPVLCLSQWIILSIIYIFTILMVLTHTLWIQIKFKLSSADHAQGNEFLNKKIGHNAAR